MVLKQNTFTQPKTKHTMQHLPMIVTTEHQVTLTLNIRLSSMDKNEIEKTENTIHAIQIQHLNDINTWIKTKGFWDITFSPLSHGPVNGLFTPVFDWINVVNIESDFKQVANLSESPEVFSDYLKTNAFYKDAYSNL
jgi:hypothetical protein